MVKREAQKSKRANILQRYPSPSLRKYFAALPVSELSWVIRPSGAFDTAVLGASA
jgi:hypothetical protein